MDGIPNGVFSDVVNNASLHRSTFKTLKSARAHRPEVAPVLRTSGLAAQRNLLSSRQACLQAKHQEMLTVFQVRIWALLALLSCKSKNS